MSVHDGHRGRLKERFLKTGLDGFEDHEVLELLLFHALPRINVNPLAHDLINRFGSLHAVFDAPIDQLKRVNGIGHNAAILIKLILPLGRRYLISQKRDIKVLNSTEKAGKFLIPYFESESDEVVYMMCLDAGYKLLGCKRMFRGTVNSASISVRKIIEYALETNCVSVIIAHNHLGGTTHPSREDKDATRRIGEALKTVEITLADHIIIANGGYVSMADTGELF